MIGKKKLYQLTTVHENGNLSIDIVDIDYNISSNPIYKDNIISVETLVYGEHLEPIYIPMWRYVIAKCIRLWNNIVKEVRQ